MAITRRNFDPANPPPLTDEMRAQLEVIEAMRDEDIDLSDTPEQLDWSNAARGKFYRPVKEQLTLRLDADVVAWFKAQAGADGGYQTRINAALRQFVANATRKAG